MDIRCCTLSSFLVPTANQTPAFLGELDMETQLFIDHVSQHKAVQLQLALFPPFDNTVNICLSWQFVEGFSEPTTTFG